MAKGTKKNGVKLTKGWDTFNQKFKITVHQNDLKKNLRPATAKVGMFVRQEMKNMFTQGQYTKNADLTIALKNSSQPLIDTGNMRNSVNYKMMKDTSVFIGIMKSDPDYERAVTVHGYNDNGAIIRVTDRMKNMFKVLHAVSTGRKKANTLKGRAAELWKKYQGPWYPISPRAHQIRIPPRPFVKQTVEKKDVIQKAGNIWMQALDKTYKQIADSVNRGK